MHGSALTRAEVEKYESWYHTRRGAWIGQAEFSLLMKLLRPSSGATLLDVGSGTGYFSRRFAAAGLRVTGLDPDPAMIAFGRNAGGGVNYVSGTATNLPFPTQSFDYVSAVTSLCFVAEAWRGLEEIWRVGRHGMVLGLLNRHSMLYRQKRGTGSYRGARWDAISDVLAWVQRLEPRPYLTARSAIFLPDGGVIARLVETITPGVAPWGGFLAVGLQRPQR